MKEGKNERIMKEMNETVHRDCIEIVLTNGW